VDITKGPHNEVEFEDDVWWGEKGKERGRRRRKKRRRKKGNDGVLEGDHRIKQ